MKVKLLRDARIRHKAGEIVEVSPAERNFLVSTGSAMEVAVNPPEVETPEKPIAKVETREKKTRKK